MGDPPEIDANAGADASRAQLLEGLERAVEQLLRVLQGVEVRHEVAAGAWALATFCTILQIFGGLVLGCIETDFCK